MVRDDAEIDVRSSVLSTNIKNAQNRAQQTTFDVRQTLVGTPSVKAAASQTLDGTSATYRREQEVTPGDQPDEKTLMKERQLNTSPQIHGISHSPARSYPNMIFSRGSLGATPVIQKGQDVLEEMKRKLSQTFSRQGNAPTTIKDPKASFVPGKNSEYRLTDTNVQRYQSQTIETLFCDINTYFM